MCNGSVAAQVLSHGRHPNVPPARFEAHLERVSYFVRDLSQIQTAERTTPAR